MAQSTLPFSPATRKICSIPDCSRAMQAQKLCNRHYALQIRHGIIHARQRPPRLPFWDNALLTANPDKCWEWQADLNDSGYGKYGYEGKTRRAHHLAWFLTNGVWPSKWILHHCDNRKCVNPKHLYEGTAQQNVDDMINRGRAPWQIGTSKRGENRPQAKLTEADVREIRRLRAEGVCTLRQLAIRFGMSDMAIHRAATGYTWKCVK